MCFTQIFCTNIKFAFVHTEVQHVCVLLLHRFTPWYYVKHSSAASMEVTFNPCSVLYFRGCSRVMRRGTCPPLGRPRYTFTRAQHGEYYFGSPRRVNTALCHNAGTAALHLAWYVCVCVCAPQFWLVNLYELFLHSFLAGKNNCVKLSLCGMRLRSGARRWYVPRPCVLL